MYILVDILEDKRIIRGKEFISSCRYLGLLQTTEINKKHKLPLGSRLACKVYFRVVHNTCLVVLAKDKLFKAFKALTIICES